MCAGSWLSVVDDGGGGASLRLLQDGWNHLLVDAGGCSKALLVDGLVADGAGDGQVTDGAGDGQVADGAGEAVLLRSLHGRTTRPEGSHSSSLFFSPIL